MHYPRVELLYIRTLVDAHPDIMASDSTGGTSGTPVHAHDEEEQLPRERFTPACRAPRRVQGARVKSTRTDQDAFQSVHCGVDGCVYYFRYEDGVVTMSNGDLECIGMSRKHDLTMSVRDYAIFRGWVCVELDKKREVVYRGRDDLVWNNPFNNRQYMIEGDMVAKPRDGFIYFHHRFSAEGRILKIRKPDGTVELSLEYTDPDMYENRIDFVIQWGDWSNMQRVLEQIDGVISRGRYGREYNSIKSEALHGYGTHSDVDFMRAIPDLCESDIRRRLAF